MLYMLYITKKSKIYCKASIYNLRTVDNLLVFIFYMSPKYIIIQVLLC